MFSSKRGMSPLIATILLIAFAVSIGAVIMSYGNAYYEEDSASGDVCSRINVAIYEIDGVPQMCKGEDYLSFILVNKGAFDIDGMKMLVSFKGETSSVETFDLESKLSSGFPFDKELSFDASKGNVAQIQMVAEMYVAGEVQKCFLDPITSIKDC